MIISYTCTILVLVMSFFWSTDSFGLKQVTPSLGAVLETPNWSIREKVLYMVNIFEEIIYRYNPKTGRVESRRTRNGPNGLIMPLANAPAGFVLLGVRSCLYVCNFDDPQNLRFLFCVDGGKPDNVLHDAKVDVKKRLWFGTFGKIVGNTTVSDQGSLYKVTNMTFYCPRVEVRPVTISDGLTWSPNNKKMYYIDQAARKIYVFDFNAEKGEIANEEVFFDFEKQGIAGAPNGMTVDSEGYVWVATFSGQTVISLDPYSRRIVYEIKVPVDQVTSIIFGGENYSTLFITTAKSKPCSKPQSGALFTWTDGKTRGLPPDYLEISDVQCY